MCKLRAFLAIIGTWIVLAAGCSSGRGGNGGEAVGVKSNLQWDQDWEQNGDAPPIEILSGTPQIGHPMKVRVRFHSEEEEGPVEIGLRIVGVTAPSGGEEATDGVVQYSLGDFLLGDPPVGPGENVYEFEVIVQASLSPLANTKCSLVGILDPRNQIVEAVEIPEDEPADPASRGDNSVAVTIDLSESARPHIVLDELRLEPGVLSFNAQEIPTVTYEYSGATFFFGEDLNGTATRVGSMTRANKARASFLSALVDPSVEDFETGFTDGQALGPDTSPLWFLPRGRSEAPEVSGEIETSYPYAHVRNSPKPQTIDGSYPTSGDSFMEIADPVSIGDFRSLVTIDLAADQPQRALGFYVTGMGNTGESTMSFWVGKRQGGGIRVICSAKVPLPSIEDPSKRNGAVFFIGFIASAEHLSFDHIEIGFEGGPNSDKCGVDDITVASQIQYDPAGQFDPLAACPPDTDSRLAANIVVSATGSVPTKLGLELDFLIQGHGEITDRLRAESKLPLRMWLDVGSSTISAFNIDPGKEAIEIPVEGGEPEKYFEPGTRKEFHLEACPPSALLQAAAGLLLEETAEPGASLDLIVDVTARITAFEGEERIGLEDDEQTAALVLRFVNPTTPKGLEWTYFKSFGDDVIGGEVDFDSGIHADGKGAAAYAGGEIDLNLFGFKLDNIIDACARASCDIASDPSTAGLALQLRNLSLGWEDGKLVTRHHVLYEKRGEVQFQDNSTPPTVELLPEIRDGKVIDTPTSFATAAGRVGLDFGADGLVLGSRSWSKCKTWLVYCIPMGAELEIGGKVGLRADFNATREAGRNHRLSLLAGPYVTFYGGASVYLGACADELFESLDRVPVEVAVAVGAAADLLECGKVAGASIELTFLDFIVGPAVWTQLRPESVAGVDGIAFEMGVDLEGHLKILEGSFSLWVHYLAPHFCWANVLGHRVPYVCPPMIDCRTAAITIASFPGFNFKLFDVELARLASWLPATTGGETCPECPR